MVRWLNSDPELVAVYHKLALIELIKANGGELSVTIDTTSTELFHLHMTADPVQKDGTRTIRFKVKKGAFTPSPAKSR